MKKTLALTAFILSALLLLTGSTLAHPTNFGAHLRPTDAAPDSRGQGQANFQLDGNDLTFIMALSNLEGEPTAAHIHFSASPGGNGSPAISLCGAFGPPPIPAENCSSSGIPTKGTISLSDALSSDLMTAVAENRAYVNVHTTAVGSGEVRGQVMINP